MTSHSASPSIHVEHNVLPNQPFFSWLRTQTTLFISQIMGILGFIAFFASLIYYSVHAAETVPGEVFLIPENITLFVDYAHILFLVVFIIALVRVLDDNDRGTYRAGLVYERVFNKKIDDPSEHKALLKKSKSQLRAFKRYFLYFWCAMLFLYVSFAFQHSIEHKARRSPVSEKRVDAGNVSIQIGIVNNLVGSGADGKDKSESSAQAKPDAGADATTKNEQSSADLGVLPKILPFFNFFLNNLGLLFVFKCFSVLYLPSCKDEESRQRRKALLKWSSTTAFWVLTLSLPLFLRVIKGPDFIDADQTDFFTWFFALSGILFAVALALLIARLDSKLVGLPSRLICVLYVYAAAQPFFAIFPQPADRISKSILTSVLITVFIFKIYFFLIIIYTLQTGRMLNYLFCFPTLSKQANLVLNQSSPPSGSQPARRAAQFISMKLLHLRQLLAGLIDRFRYNRLSLDREFFSGLKSKTASFYAGLKKQPRSFFSWLRDKFYYPWLKKESTLFIFWMFCVISLLAFLLAKRRVDSTDFKTYLYYAHIPLLALIVAIIKVLLNRNHGSDEGKLVFETLFGRHRSELEPKFLKTSRSQLRQFKRYFLGFWCAILVLYLVFAIQHKFPEDGPSRVATISSLTFAFQPQFPDDRLFGVTKISSQANTHNQDYNKDSAPHPSPQQPTGARNCAACAIEAPPRLLRIAEFFGDRFHMLVSCQRTQPFLYLSEALNRMFFPFLVFALSNANILFVFWCFVVLYLPLEDRKSRRHRLLRNFSILIVTLFTLLFPLLLFLIESNGFSVKDLDGYSTVFNAVSGTLSAVGLALLIARLDSKMIGLPSPLVSVLYFYAALQPFFIVFDLKIPVFQNIQISVLILVFILKIYFFLVIIYIVQTGRLLNYLICFPFLNQRVNSIFDNQFEIKTHREPDHSFGFSITKRNDLVYFTDARFSSREDCDQTIKNLQELMKNSLAYVPDEISGTHWVKVVDIYNDPICESTGLRSKDEADELKKESMEKIPYCKYDRG